MQRRTLVTLQSNCQQLPRKYLQESPDKAWSEANNIQAFRREQRRGRRTNGKRGVEVNWDKKQMCADINYKTIWWRQKFKAQCQPTPTHFALHFNFRLMYSFTHSNNKIPYYQCNVVFASMFYVECICNTCTGPLQVLLSHCTNRTQ